MRRLGELVTAAVAGSCLAQHGKKVATQEMLSALLWRWHILENGSWKAAGTPETQGCSRSERHLSYPQMLQAFPPLVALCSSRGTDAMADLPFSTLRVGAGPSVLQGQCLWSCRWC